MSATKSQTSQEQSMLLATNFLLRCKEHRNKGEEHEHLHLWSALHCQVSFKLTADRCVFLSFPDIIPHLCLFFQLRLYFFQLRLIFIFNTYSISLTSLISFFIIFSVFLSYFSESYFITNLFIPSHTALELNFASNSWKQFSIHSQWAHLCYLNLHP